MRDHDPLRGVPGLALVRLLARLVPAARRDDWRAEWTGELAHAWHAARASGDDHALARLALALRAAGALPDALCVRRLHGARAMHDLDLDLRVAVRALRRRPGFVAVVVLTLALGIGATTALFSVVNGVLLRPLPLPGADRLVMVEGVGREGETEKVGRSASYPDFVDLRAGASSVEAMGAMRTAPQALVDARGAPANARVTLATADVWRVLGARAIAGRLPRADEERPGAAPVAVLGHGFWQRRYGGDRGVVGRVVSLDGQPVEVVGVAAPGARLVEEPDVWRPLVPTTQDLYRGRHALAVVARLRDGVPRGAAERELRAIARRLELAYPEDNAHRSARLVPLRDAIVGDSRPGLLVLFGAVVLVLLVGCGNLASLFLARAAARGREMAVRTALGAPRGRLVRQWMVESALLTAAGAVLGSLVAWAGTRALLVLVPRTMPRADEVGVDGRVLLFLLGVSVATGLAFGMLPALARGGARQAPLHDGTRGAATGTRARRRGRHLLVGGEVALATMLVVGALLLVKNLWQLGRAELHFAPDGLVVLPVQPPARYDSAHAVEAFYRRLADEARAVPGVRALSFAYEHPLGGGWTSSYAIEGEPAPPRGSEPESGVRPVRPGYFRTAGVPLVAGRDVSEGDRWNAPGVVVVNEAFVRRHFGGDARRALGRRLLRSGWWPGQPEAFTIVGVAADEPMQGPGVPATPSTYYAHAQFPLKDMWIVARVADDAATAPAIAALRAAVWRVDPTIPMDEAHRMRDLLGQSVAEPRFAAGLLSLFAATALLLAALGLYGLLAYGVAQRTAEIGVRMALGADRAHVMRAVVGEGLLVALVGVALGVGGALALGDVLASLLHGVAPRDPAVLGTVPVLLLVVSTLAALLPARRASRVNPMVALRAE